MAREVSARAKPEAPSTVEAVVTVAAPSKAALPLKRGLAEDERVLVELFAEFDRDGDGGVSHMELKKYLKSTEWAASYVQREGFSWHEASHPLRMH